MRDRTIVALVFALVIGGGRPLPASIGSVRVHLTCDETAIQVDEHLLCRVLIENPRGHLPVLAPRSLLPGVLPHRPPTVLEFYLGEGERRQKVAVASAAERGRYDWGTMSSTELLLLHGGGILGWTFDLNGHDWVLPAGAGTYVIRAKVRIRLLEPRKGAVDPAVVEASGGLERARLLALDGEWISNPLTITVVDR